MGGGGERKGVGTHQAIMRGRLRHGRSNLQAISLPGGVLGAIPQAHRGLADDLDPPGGLRSYEVRKDPPRRVNPNGPLTG
eukprot:6050544-Alexandrium_andersonii.AAC.1